jgi:hypothetical protein
VLAWIFTTNRYSLNSESATGRRSASVGRSVRISRSDMDRSSARMSEAPYGAKVAPFTQGGSPVKSAAWFGQVQVPGVVTSSNTTPPRANPVSEGVVSRGYP